jgi:hypothetical protein
MKTCVEKPGCFEFSFPQLETLASVECMADEVVIRTSRNTLSEERKAAFIRELASEGFIPDHCYWLHSGGDSMPCRVRWLVDPAWWMPDAESKARTSRFMFKVLATTALLWVIMLVLLLGRAAH